MKSVVALPNRIPGRSLTRPFRRTTKQAELFTCCIAEKRNLIHKIGVTNLDVDKRINGARLDPTFLMADVEVVATYKLYNINRTKLENLIHRIFAPARLNIEIKDRFGNPVVPREWFLVPLHAIDDAVDKIRDKTITQYRYDTKTATFIQALKTG